MKTSTSTSSKLYTGLLAYALLRGAARGLRKRSRRGITIAAADAILKQAYYEPIMEALHQSSFLMEAFRRDEFTACPNCGSMEIMEAYPSYVICRHCSWGHHNAMVVATA